MAKTLSARISEDDFTWLDAESKRLSLDKSEFVRRIFKEYRVSSSDSNVDTFAKAANVIVSSKDFNDRHPLVRRIVTNGLEVKNNDGDVIFKIKTTNDLLDFCYKNVFKWK